MNGTGSTGLSRYHAARTESMDQGVKTAVSAMLASGVSISISAVARHARVSRAFIHNHKDLHEHVQRAASRSREKADETTRRSVTSAESQIRTAERLTFAAKIKQLKHTIDTQRFELGSLRAERSRWLGTQVELLTGPTQEFVALQEALSDALVERDKFQSLATEQAKRADQMDRKLNAVRQAYKEDLGSHRTSANNVLGIDGSDRST